MVSFDPVQRVGKLTHGSIASRRSRGVGRARKCEAAGREVVQSQTERLTVGSLIRKLSGVHLAKEQHGAAGDSIAGLVDDGIRNCPTPSRHVREADRSLRTVIRESRKLWIA